MACTSFSQAFWVLMFESQDLTPCEGPEAVFAFAALCALAFGAFVLIDFLLSVIVKYGFQSDEEGMGIEHGWSTFFIIVFGMVAAFIVGFFAAIIDFLQLNAQTAVATGVLWQIVYARMLSHFRERNAAAGRDQPPPEAIPDSEIVQPVTEELEE